MLEPTDGASTAYRVRSGQFPLVLARTGDAADAADHGPRREEPFARCRLARDPALAVGTAR
ncbi:MAG: hypothetical protein C0607_12920, partial [Azoarcus sp.]